HNQKGRDATRSTLGQPYQRCPFARGVLPPYLAHDGAEVPRHALLHLGVEVPVSANQLPTEGGERGAPAPAAAFGGHSDALTEAMIQAVEQLPGTAVAHTELARRL